jgi:hypothetical protein
VCNRGYRSSTDWVKVSSFFVTPPSVVQPLPPLSRIALSPITRCPVLNSPILEFPHNKTPSPAVPDSSLSRTNSLPGTGIAWADCGRSILGTPLAASSRVWRSDHDVTLSDVPMFTFNRETGPSSTGCLQTRTARERVSAGAHSSTKGNPPCVTPLQYRNRDFFILNHKHGRQ